MTNDKTDLPRIRIKPLNDMVLLQRKKAPAQTASGLHLPDKQDHTHGKVIECRVLAVGPGDIELEVQIWVMEPHHRAALFDRVMPVQPGDIVLVCEEALHPVTHDGLELDFCPASSLFGAVEAD